MRAPAIQPPDQETLDAFGRLLYRVTDPRLEFGPTILKILGDLRGQYHVFQVPKGNGRMRTIEAPENKNLKPIQHMIHDRLLRRVRLPEEVYGFRIGTGAYKGLRRMADNIQAKRDGTGELKSVYQLDIKDFFPSTTCEMVTSAVRLTLRRILRARPVEGEGRPFLPLLPQPIIDKVSQLIAQLCCIPDDERGTLRLSQGAPTSPALSNMVAARTFDPVLVREIGEDFEYGRYADDMVILGVEPMSRKVRDRVIAIVQSTGYNIAHGKTEYDEEKNKYRVWGVDLIPADKDGGIRFRLPGKSNKKGAEGEAKRLTTERRYRNEILKVIDGEALPRKRKHGQQIYAGPPAAELTEVHAFMGHPDVQRVMGNLSHAYVVTKYGRDKSRIPPLNNHDPVLPGELRHAWEKFRETFGDRLPPTHPGWFTGFDFLETKRNDEFPVTAENAAGVLDARVARLAEFRKIPLEELTEKMKKARAAMRKRFPSQDEDGQQFGVDKKSGDEIYPDAELGQEVKDLLKSYDDKQKAARKKKILDLLLQHAAYLQLRLDDSFSGFDLFHKGSILPEEMALRWEKLIDRVCKEEEFDLLRGCRYFFRDRERTVVPVEHWTRKKEPDVRRKTFLYFPGLTPDE